MNRYILSITQVSDFQGHLTFNDGLLQFVASKPLQYAYLAMGEEMCLTTGFYQLEADVALERGGVTVGIIDSEGSWISNVNIEQSQRTSLSFCVSHLTRKRRKVKVVIAACNKSDYQPVEAIISNLQIVPKQVGTLLWPLIRLRDTVSILKRYWRTSLLSRFALLKLKIYNRVVCLLKPIFPKTYYLTSMADAGYATRGISLATGQNGNFVVAAGAGDDTISFFKIESGKLMPRSVVQLPYRLAPFYIETIPDGKGNDRIIVCLFNFGGGDRPQISYLADFGSAGELINHAEPSNTYKQYQKILSWAGYCGFRGCVVLGKEDSHYSIGAVNRDGNMFHFINGLIEDAQMKNDMIELPLGKGVEPIGITGFQFSGSSQRFNFYISSRARKEIFVIAVQEKEAQIVQTFPIEDYSRSSVTVGRFFNSEEKGVALALWGGDPKDLNSIMKGHLLIGRLDDKGQITAIEYVPAGVHPTDAVSGDFDGDGVDEIAVLNYGNGLGLSDRRHTGGVQIFKYITNRFQCIAKIPLPSPRIGAAIDIDGDGIDELVVSLFFEKKIVVIKAA